ncbi:2-keto-4-pentenoate hydratase/2-oxohepta-3-ene-1,7-dioic acid hydratase (catechol pathway) [Marininema mesophilum]|uniref:2-keto-4-pentenoate hydratase/2-oxohepta-3-ene-1,7-dioic acid hydratase (Catechol pathway) n=1 Tax=Marininema mesophilum TaxID=1048340 RepID=A0A1H2QK95_9BACL|nr:fumarylacetoacetate hydrolase family protein [Marininema mesophilum]SDW07310.1 2-keto-4-pentenoate hydratase/2-oxohepta-3-ene-1,7-dioic acid hydratase (catechol pathway) [Marininema mesophilum]
MKIIRFRHHTSEPLWGVLEEEGIRPLPGGLFGGGEPEGELIPFNEVEILAPLVPQKLIAVGRNYTAHAAEKGNAVPTEPMIFLVSPTAVIGSDEVIQLPNTKDRIEYEGELAVVIGKGGKDIPRENALEHVLGYTGANDVSNRDLQKKDGQFTRAKSFDTFKPLGPVIETKLDPSDIRLVLRVNGEIRQDGRTSDMVHDIPGQIAFISSIFPLERGDVILTGTPAGVGPLRPGDEVEMTIEGIGTLRSRVEVKLNS